MEVFLGSGPDRGQSPVEWGEIPYVRPYVRTSPLWLALRPCWLAPRPLQLAAGQMDGWMDGWMDAQTYGISPHSTGLCPLSEPLPKKGEKTKKAILNSFCR